jgi:hypothetical protein
MNLAWLLGGANEVSFDSRTSRANALVEMADRTYDVRVPDKK